jgi:hypothetical protein
MHSLIQIELARSLAGEKAATKLPAPRETRRRRALRRRRRSWIGGGFTAPSKGRRPIEIG